MSDDQGEPQPPSLEQRRRQAGRKPGDRYVRVVRPAGRQFRKEGDRYVATEDVFSSTGIGRAIGRLQRILIGGRLGSEAESEQRLSKKTGLAILASDNISSSAYATEEAMRVLALAGVAALTLTMPIALAVVAVLAIVILSESRVIRAYPNGGGSYLVARENHGTIAGLVAAAALLIDYVLTVAVSTAAGVAAISSFVPAVHDHRVLWGLVLIGLLTIGNLRGVREAGIVFAAPTYAYIVATLGLIGYGLFRFASGDLPVAAVAPHPFPEGGTEALSLLLVLRAFASGSVGLTGSEAIANGVPSFKPKETTNAVITLVLMGALFAVIFVGLTSLATALGVRPDQGELETLNSLVTRSIVGRESPYYLFVQITTAIILALAANTGFTGFPRLASVLANDRFMPRHFAELGSRLAFNFGILALAVTAAAVLAGFGGSVTALVPLYTIGVFLAFTLSQSGLVRRWWRLRNPGWQLSMVINSIGAIVTGVVLVVVAYTKFPFGAWMVIVVLPIIVLVLYGTFVHYRDVQDALVLTEADRGLPEPHPPVVVVPVARIDRAALQALAFARSISKTVRAVHIVTSAASAREFRKEWERWAPQVKLDVIESPYRSVLAPLLRYIDALDKAADRPLTVVLAEFVPRHWWEWFLHSQIAARLKVALLFRQHIIVIDVPYHFQDTGDLARHRGDDDGGGEGHG
ncbi:APC family permease [soil metagenome]